MLLVDLIERGLLDAARLVEARDGLHEELLHARRVLQRRDLGRREHGAYGGVHVSDAHQSGALARTQRVAAVAVDARELLGVVAGRVVALGQLGGATTDLESATRVTAHGGHLARRERDRVRVEHVELVQTQRDDLLELGVRVRLKDEA